MAIVFLLQTGKARRFFNFTTLKKHNSLNVNIGYLHILRKAVCLFLCKT
jgi:hypothetical protein